MQLLSTPVSLLRTSLLLAIGALLLSPSAVSAKEERNGIISVFSSVSPAYTRAVLPGGKFKPETYAFGEGGDWGGPQKDDTIDKLNFMDIARKIAPSLASQNFVPTNTKDPSKTDLLIMVYWGTTSGTNDSGTSSSSAPYQIAQGMQEWAQGGSTNAFDLRTVTASPAISGTALDYILFANNLRDRQNDRNAEVLGYLPELFRIGNYGVGGPLQRFRQDVIDDVEENRYFVVLIAYDFQKIWKHKQRQIMWQTRYSIRAHDNDFDKQLASISQYASRYFGQDSDGLIRKHFGETNVTIGDSTFLSYEPEKKSGSPSIEKDKPNQQ